LNAKRLKELIDEEVSKFRKAEKKRRAILEKNRRDFHYVLDQASKGKPTSEEV
jgi:hypothetical protein